MKFLLTNILIFLIAFIGCKAQKISVPPKNTYSIIEEVPSPSIVHGAGFARLSNFNPERSFEEAKLNAVIDLEASILTSVYLEYYGTNEQSRLNAEFSISDTIISSEVAIIDSVIVGDWAVYFIRDINDSTNFPSQIIDKALTTKWRDELYEPINIEGFWISSGMNTETPFNPGRGWTLAKQNALQNLSEYLNTKVQSLEKTFDNTLSSVHYVTSKHVFNHIGVLSRHIIDNTYYVLVIVNEKNIIRIDG